MAAISKELNLILERLSNNDPDLKKLFLSHKCNDNDIKLLAKALKSNTNLTYLDLRFNCFADGGINAIAKILKINNTLTRLEINITNKYDYTVIAEGIKYNHTLEHLTLYSIEDIKANIIPITTALITNTALTRLDFNAFGVGNEATQAIVNLIKNNTTLITIALECYHIDTTGIKWIANALKTNRKLKYLNLYNNNINNEGAQAIADAIKTNKTLKIINLNSNNICNAGAIAIANALKFNNSLTHVRLGWNDFETKGVKALAETIKVNKNLSVLTLEGIKLNNDSVKAIAGALKINKTLYSLSNNKYYASGSNYNAKPHLINEIMSALDKNKMRVKTSKSEIRKCALTLSLLYKSEKREFSPISTLPPEMLVEILKHTGDSNIPEHKRYNIAKKNLILPFVNGPPARKKPRFI